MARKEVAPEQEAAYALMHDLPRSGLGMAAQLAYDRLSQENAQVWSEIIGPQAAEGQQPDQLTGCTACGEELTLDARFCASCGQPTKASPPDTNCSECGEELTPGARFCASCGKPVSDNRQVAGSRREKSREFAVKYVTFYDGSGHRLGPSNCTLTSTRLIINDARGGIHQIPLDAISGISTPSRLGDPKMMRISLPGQAYDVVCKSRDQKSAIEAWLGEAIRGSF